MHELAIVGAGPVGLSAAIAATYHGIDCALLDARAPSAGRDPRVFALSYASRLVLERLEVWAKLGAIQPILQVHVSERGAFGATTLSAAELDLPTLGYVVPQAELVAGLRARADECGIERISGAEACDVIEHNDCAAVQFERDARPGEIEAGIVALAEGGAVLAARMGVVERDYAQHALIATLEASRAARDCAYERFTPSGPIALLPLGAQHALIWTVPSAEAESLVALDDRQFKQALVSRYGERIGAIDALGPRSAFALKLRFAPSAARGRTVLIGNSAQTLHPVAGQGFNLGLRDAFELAQAIRYCTARAQGLAAAVERYRSKRRADRFGGTLFTDLLVRGFSNDIAFVSFARSASLAALDAFEPAKQWLTRRMIFGAPR
jgi:2-octaprenyl-6-methoxyphenol hydroxylase